MRVAVIDSGIDAAHPWVGAVAGYMAVAERDDGALEFDDRPHADVYGHGTACASIIRSIAPDCELYSVRVLDRRLGGSARVLTAGLAWAIDNGMHVCNLSLGTTRREFAAELETLARRAVERNVALVAAVNNAGVESFPAAFDSVISVVAHADPERIYANADGVLGAFGVGVEVAWLDGLTIRVAGNSFAAPRVSGLVARMLAERGATTVTEITARLRAAALAHTPGDPPIAPTTYGRGA